MPGAGRGCLTFVKAGGPGRASARMIGETPPETPVAKVYFRYAAMNAGKSTRLLQVRHNYHERHQRTLLPEAAPWPQRSRRSRRA